MPPLVINRTTFERTFPTQERAEELLRPELENGTLTTHDFDLATRSLPGRSSRSEYRRFAYGFGAGLATATYGRYFRRPPWRIRQFILWTGLASIGGHLIAEWQEFTAQIRWAQSLDNPQAVQAAVKKVLAKADGSNSSSTDNHSFDPPTPDGTARDGWQMNGQSVPADNSRGEQTSAKPSHRWDEIRANARGAAKASSWDMLRQTHERERIAGASASAGRSVSTEMDAKDERALEQERFNVMLEEERRKSQS